MGCALGPSARPRCYAVLDRGGQAVGRCTPRLPFSLVRWRPLEQVWWPHVTFSRHIRRSGGRIVRLDDKPDPVDDEPRTLTPTYCGGDFSRITSTNGYLARSRALRLWTDRGLLLKPSPCFRRRLAPKRDHSARTVRGRSATRQCLQGHQC